VTCQRTGADLAIGDMKPTTTNVTTETTETRGMLDT
jgi:hypothetical protein